MQDWFNLHVRGEGAVRVKFPKSTPFIKKISSKSLVLGGARALAGPPTSATDGGYVPWLDVSAAA